MSGPASRLPEFVYAPRIAACGGSFPSASISRGTELLRVMISGLTYAKKVPRHSTAATALLFARMQCRALASTARVNAPRGGRGK